MEDERNPMKVVGPLVGKRKSRGGFVLQPARPAWEGVIMRQTRHFVMLLWHVISPTNHEFLSIVYFLLEDLLLYRRLHWSSPLQLQREVRIIISQITTEWCRWSWQALGSLPDVSDPHVQQECFHAHSVGCSRVVRSKNSSRMYMHQKC